MRGEVVSLPRRRRETRSEWLSSPRGENAWGRRRRSAVVLTLKPTALKHRVSFASLTQTAARVALSVLVAALLFWMTFTIAGNLAERWRVDIPQLVQLW